MLTWLFTIQSITISIILYWHAPVSLTYTQIAPKKYNYAALFIFYLRKSKKECRDRGITAQEVLQPGINV